MIKYKFALFYLVALITFQGCTKILEPVMLEGIEKENFGNLQEEFNVNVLPLTFDNANTANRDNYPRKLSLLGSGASANIINEKDLLVHNTPDLLSDNEYRLGIGDELQYMQINEFMNEKVEWPIAVNPIDYVLGPGDELVFVQFTETADIEVIIDDDGEVDATNKLGDNLLQTKGIIGSNGNMLLIGIGNINAAGRTLNDLRTEVRNILIRNGLTPNFQLEIEKFVSQKAYISTNISVPPENINLNNIPISLREIALSKGVSGIQKNNALIKLIRNKKIFKFTAKQLFNSNSPDVFIQDQDYVEIEVLSNKTNVIKTRIGEKGKILLNGIGTLNAQNLTLSELDKVISDILIQKGLVPSFQLKISKFESKKIYLITKADRAKIVPLNNHEATMRALLINEQISSPSESLTIVTLNRNQKKYRLPFEMAINPNTPDIFLRGEDQIEVQTIPYKDGKIYTISGTNVASITNIKPSQRETLADILFKKGGAINNINVKRSEVYLLRGSNPVTAYHLDAQNVSRILVAAKTELRPNDIIYVADRPIISFVRLLSEISPLRSLLRDLKDNDFP